MNPKPTLQTLQLDCVLEILQYVSLPECMFLRSSCASLKTAVDEHFRTNVKTLPVMLSDHYSADIFTKIEKYCERRESFYKKISFGSTSGVSQRNLWDNREMRNLDRIQHFRRDNYLILTDMSKFGVFVHFVTKYLPKITKLALIIDHSDHVNNIPEVLNIYRKQLKVLLIDRTLRASLKFDVYSHRWKCIYPAVHQSFELTEALYHSIDNLGALEELYFFAIEHHHGFRLGPDPSDISNRFVESMFRKLRVLHLNCDGIESLPNRPVDLPFKFQSEVYEKLEELACWSSYSFRENANSKVSFPRLRKIIFFDDDSPLQHRMDSKLLTNLREISFPNCSSLSIKHVNGTGWNHFPNLERLHCRRLSGNISKDQQNNNTVEFIEIDKLVFPPIENDWDGEIHEDSLEEGIQRARAFFRYFRNLKKAVIQEPSMELTGTDLQRFLAAV